MKKLLLLGLGFLFVLSSCEPEELEYEDYKPIVAAPLIYSVLDVYDVLNRVDSLDELIVIDEDGLLALTYQGRLLSLELDDVISFQDVNENFSASINSSQAAALNSGGVASLSIDYPIELSSEIQSGVIRIDSVLLSSGNLTINLNLLQEETIVGTLSIPSLRNAQGDVFNRVLSNNDFNNGSYSSTIILSGYTLYPDYTAPNSNSFDLTVNFSLSDNPGNTAVSGELFSGSLSLSNFNFAYVFGYFGQVAVNTDQDSVTIRIFENAIDGFFRLEQATISLITTNSFGIPVAIDFDNLSSINLNTGVITPMLINDDFEISEQLSILSPPSVSTFVIDQNNSNIAAFLEPTPKTLFFQLNATCNPDGEPSPPQTNFIASDSRLDVDIEVLLPLLGYAQDIVIRDTLDAEINFDEFDEVDSLEFKLFTLNGFPADAEIQLTFLNEFDNPIDFLFEGGTNDLTLFMESGIVNENGIVISPTEKITTRSVDQTGAENLKQTRKIVVSSRLNTGDSDQEQIVRFMDDYTLEVKMGVKIYGNIEL